MLLEAKASESAAEWYRKVLLTDPQNPEASVGYGLALYQSGDKKRFAEAARYFQSVIDQAPEGNSWRHVAAETLEKLKANP
jgi:cytochrome c-type biogenesis protein CcmH/NrfG